MAKMVKCPHCEKKYDRETEECEKVGSRYYHSECFVEYKKLQTEKEVKKEQKKTQVNPIETQRRDLIGYIMKLKNTDRLNALVFKQIKELNEQGYSYVGMQSTLYYFHEIMGNPVIGTGIGIVPYVYDDAKEWYIRKSVAGKHFDELIKGGMTELTTKKSVKVHSQKLETRLKNKIDISSL